jgi:putative transposase
VHPCLTRSIHALGFAVSERTVGRSLSKQDLRCRHKVKVKFKFKFKHTTDSKHHLPIADNLLNRQFAVAQPNAVWAGDITLIQTVEGWLYLATMIDLFNRQVVG